MVIDSILINLKQIVLLLVRHLPKTYLFILLHQPRMGYVA